MNTRTQLRPVPGSREIRRHVHVPNDTESHHDDPIAPVLASVLRDTHIVVRTPIADAFRNREQDPAALDHECAFGQPKRQGAAGWSGAPQARPTRRRHSHSGTKVLAGSEGAIEKNDIGAPVSKVITMNTNYQTGAKATVMPNNGQRGRGSIMNRLVCIAVGLLCATSVNATDLGVDMTNASVHNGPVLSTWNPVGVEIGYGFAGQVERLANRLAKPWTVLTVGAQINATESHQRELQQ